MKKPLLPTALVTLALGACGDAGPSVVTSSHELTPGAERTQVAQRAVEQVLLNGTTLGVGARDALTARSVVVDDDGSEHVHLDRTHGGLRVIGGDIVSHRRAGSTANDFQVAAGQAVLSQVAQVPLVSQAEALRRAEGVFVGQLAGASRSALVVDARPGLTPGLAHEVLLAGTQPDGTPSRLHVLVDAATGAVRGQWEGIHTLSAQGVGRSLYSGSVALSTTTEGSGFALRDSTRGAGFQTVDLNNQGNSTLPVDTGEEPTGTLFTDADNVWGDGTPADRASAAVDAHFGQQVTYDYYLQNHGRDGIDGLGHTGFSRVHYGSKYNNAYWSDDCFCMTYGDGDGKTFTPLTSLDVAGHEMTHGVTSRTAGLMYMGESGGLNEATSDIFGTLVEFHAQNARDPGDYLIGETIYTPAKAGDALRYMYQPSLDGTLPGQSSPDCWSPTLGALDVHYSSGVANHFFYLLAEGSRPANGPASPTCDGSRPVGIGRQKAGKIWYRALTVYMTSTTNYAGARTASLNAARDLYGVSSAEAQAVAAAWSAVSVN